MTPAAIVSGGPDGGVVPTWSVNGLCLGILPRFSQGFSPKYTELREQEVNRLQVFIVKKEPGSTLNILSQADLKELDLDQWLGHDGGACVQSREDREEPDPTRAFSYPYGCLELYQVSCPIVMPLVMFHARPEIVDNVATLAIKFTHIRAGLRGPQEAAPSSLRIGTSTSSTRVGEARSSHYTYPRHGARRRPLLDVPRRLSEPRAGASVSFSMLGCTLGELRAVADDLRRQIDYLAARRVVETFLVHDGLQRLSAPCDEPTLAALGFRTVANFATNVSPVPPDTYTTEHVYLTLAVGAAPSPATATTYINTHGSYYTGCIVTESIAAGRAFVRGVNSAGMFVNATTGLDDDFHYGFDAEFSISTKEIHTWRSIRLEGLVAYKYVLRSQCADGYVVGEFGSELGKRRLRTNPSAQLNCRSETSRALSSTRAGAASVSSLPRRSTRVVHLEVPPVTRYGHRVQFTNNRALLRRRRPIVPFFVRCRL
ncbi:hypothetical protein EI94DRAFT_1785900 [Lactarius quietus]|nr:hypothetical protein EI94DRAFT_1785900 [Lactarius quietus]